MAFGKISGGYEISTGLAAGVLIGLPVGYYAGPALLDGLNGDRVRDMSACVDYETTHPEKTDTLVPAFSIPEDVLSACGLTTYVVSPNDRKVDENSDDTLAYGAKVEYEGVKVQLPNRAKLTAERDSLEITTHDKLFWSGMSGVYGAMIGLCAGGLLAKRRKRLSNMSTYNQNRYSR